MAELKQERFGVKTDFQTITPHKAPDTTEQNIKTGLGLAEGLGRASASQAGRDNALSITGGDLTLKRVNQNVDLFENEVTERVTDAQVAGGGTINARQLAEIKDSVLDKVKLSSRGLQEAINRGAISHLEATARANINIQRSSNTLIGSLFKDEYRNAFAGVTGNPAGSPAMALNKSPAEIQQEANKKAVMTVKAQRKGQIQAYADKFQLTPIQAESRMNEIAYNEAEAVKRDALDKTNARTDEERLRYLPDDFSTGVNNLMADATVAFSSNGGIEPNEVASITASIANTKNQIIMKRSQGGMGSGSYKKLVDFADNWEKQQVEYISAISQAKISKETTQLLNESMKRVMAGELPLVYAVSQFNPTLAQSLGMMDEQTRLDLVKRLGIDITKVTNLAEVFGGVSNTFDPTKKITPQEAKNVAPVLAGNSGDQNKKIIDTFVEGGGDVSDLNVAWQQAPAMSLRTVADSLQGQIESGDKNSTAAGINIMNLSVDKYRRLITDYNVDQNHVYSVQGNVNTMHQQIDIPDGVPDSEADIVRQLYRAIKSTPSLWRDDFDSPMKAFEGVMNDGYRFSADATSLAPYEIQPSNTIWEVLGDFADTSASRIRKGEGVEPTAKRPPMEQLNIIVEGLASGQLKGGDPKVMQAISQLTGEINEIQKGVDAATASDNNQLRKPDGKVVKSFVEETEGKKFANRTTVVDGEKSPVVDEGLQSVKDAIANVETAHGADNDKAYSQPPNSSGYEGKYQFRYRSKKDAGFEIATKLGIDPKAPKTPEEQEAIMDEYLNINSKMLKNKGIPVTPYNLWLAHNQGAGGANAILSGKLTDTIRRNIRNQGVSGKTDAELIANYHNKFRTKFGDNK